MKQLIIILFFLFAPAVVLAAPPKAPLLGKAEIVSSTHIRWHFKNVDAAVVGFELWDAIARRVIMSVQNSKAAFIDEKNIVPADPDMACGRYVAAVNKNGERSFGPVLTYPCVRTPPVPPPAPVIEQVKEKVINITVRPGDNDPAVALGIYEANRGVWVSPENLFVAAPYFKSVGEWGSDWGSLLIGIRPGSSYEFRAIARSVTGELSAWSQPSFYRLPAESGEPYAPLVDVLGENIGLANKNSATTFRTKSEQPLIAGIFSGTAVTVTLDDRPYLALVKGDGAVKNFSFIPAFKIGTGYHYLRVGAHRSGMVAWGPTIEFAVSEVKKR
jgi:hypothetical protein